MWSDKQTDGQSDYFSYLATQIDRAQIIVKSFYHWYFYFTSITSTNQMSF